LLAFFSLASHSSAQNTDAKYKVGITTGAFVPEKVDAKNQLYLWANDMFEGKYFRLLQFYELPSATQRQEWANSGLSLTDYLPGQVYFAVIESRFELSTIANELRAVLAPDKRFKQEADVYFNGIPNHSIKAGGANMTISYYRGLNAEAIINDLEKRKVVVGKHRDYSYQLEIKFEPSRLEEITNLPYVQFISAQPAQPSLETNNLAYRNASDRANYLNTGFNGINYNGAGIAIAIGEGGIIGDEIDFQGRVTELSLGAPGSHKIGCMGNAASAGNLDPQDRSHAWGATLLSTENENYPNLINTQNARYFNHSYGFGVQGGYSSSARDHDLRVVAHPNHVVSYSSGNVGTDTGYAPYDGFNDWANITGSVKQNKNHLVVANLSPYDDVLNWGCKGPAFDGRILPHIIVAGPEGTSYASPKAVGLFAQLEQAYISINGQPSAGSLMRAIVFNTADDMGNAGLDFQTGYGRPNAKRALQVITNNQVFTGLVAHNANTLHNINVPVGTSKVKIMLVWPDAAAAVNANPTIVNNLNLTAIDPNATIFNPWVLDHTPNPANLNAPATRQVDNLNTIEQITVDNPAAGNWAVQINGANVPSGPQRYYISYEFVTDELSMAYPLENEKFISGDTYILKWDSYIGTGTFTLAYQIDGGSWQTIAGNIAASTRSYAWAAPYMAGIHTIKFRVKRDGLVSESGINRFGAIPSNVRITKVCADTVTLKWASVNAATGYKVYRLGAMYMQEVTSNITFTANSAVLTGQSTTNNEYYAVSAVTGLLEGQRTIAVKKLPGNLNCTTTDWLGVVSNDWFNVNNWSAGVLPTCADNIIIRATAPNQPIINAAGATCGSITIENGAILSMSGATIRTLSVCGDWVNNGNFVRGAGIVDFMGTNDYQELSGTSTTAFNLLHVSKGAINKVLEITALITLNAPTNPLVINSGTFKLSSASVLSPFATATGANLNSIKSIWNNGGTLNYGNFSWFNDASIFRLTAGTVNVGTSAGNSITYLNNGQFIIEGGVLNIAGGLRPNSGTSFGVYTQHGGEVNVCLQGSASTTRAAFELNTGVPFTMTGGTISIRRATSHTTSDIIISSTTNTVSGGMVKIGDASTPAAQTIRINSTAPIYDFWVNATNAPTARLAVNSLVVKNNLTIQAGTLNANSLNLSVGGNWANSGTFVPTTSTVTFNGFIPQNILGSSATNFNNLNLNNALGLSLAGATNTTVGNLLTLSDGVISTNANRLIIGNAGTVSRTNGHIFGNLQKPILAGANVLQTFELGDANINNYTPATLNFASVTTAGNILSKVVAADHPNIASSTLIANNSVNRYWILDNNGVVFSTYDAEFSFLGTDLDAATNFANLVAGKFNPPTWTYPTVGNRTATSTQITGVTSFSDFQLAQNIATALPIELIYFEAKAVGKNVRLDWATATEINSDYFILEKSPDAISWQELTRVKAIGNSSSEQNYTNMDISPYRGVNYYRLKQVDMDGQFDYSPIRAVNFNEQLVSEPVVYPNPSNGVFYIENYNLEQIRLFTVDGKEISLQAQFNPQAQVATIDLKDMPAGIYLLRIGAKTVKMIKNNP